MATILTQADDDRIKSYQKQYAERQAAGASQGELSDIHHAAEVIRNRYGYSGGDDGSGYVPLSDTVANTSSTSSNPTAVATQNNYLNQLYAAKRAQTLAGLKSAYDQNVSTLNANAAKIPEIYTTAKNTTAGNAAVNQANFNERAAASGLNSGAGSQAALSMGNALTSNLSALDKERASKLSDIETQKANLSAQYQNAIASAVSSNNIALAQLLYEESVRAQNQLLEQQRYDALNAKSDLANEKSEYADNKMTYYNDYQAEINNVLGDNDPTNDWKADKLKGWRNEKLLAQEAAALKAAKTASGDGYRGPKSATMSYSQLNSALATIIENQDETAAYNFLMENGGQYTDQLLAIYNLSGNVPPPTTPRTANYGSSTVTDVNDRLNAGYTPQEVMAAAKEKYGVNSNEYKNIVSAVLRR